MDKFLTSNTLVSKVDLFIGQSVIPAPRVLYKHTNQGSALADDPESVTVRIDETCVFSAKWPQEQQRRASPDGITQPTVNLIATTPRKTKHSRSNKSVAPPRTEMSLFNDAQCDYLPIGCTAQPHFEDVVLVAWVRNAKKPMKASVLRVAI